MRKKPLLFAAAALSLSLSVSLPAAWAQTAPDAATAAAAPAKLTDDEVKKLGQGIVFPHDLLEAVLSKNVDKEGLVAYSMVKGDVQLETYVRAVALADLTRFPVFTTPADPKDPKSKPTVDRRAELAFWINAYNALFLKAVADAYPVNSVSQIPNLDSAKTRVVAGKAYSFAELRRKIATEFDNRALFAMQDGTTNGPRPLPVAMRFSGLGDTLSLLVQAYVIDPTKVGNFNVGSASGDVEVNPWLATVDEYFKGVTDRRKWDGIRNVLRMYSKSGPSRNFFLTRTDYDIKFMPGSGAINEKLSR